MCLESYCTFCYQRQKRQRQVPNTSTLIILVVSHSKLNVAPIATGYGSTLDQNKDKDEVDYWSFFIDEVNAMNACGLIWMIIRTNNDVKKVWRRIEHYPRWWKWMEKGEL